MKCESFTDRRFCRINNCGVFSQKIKCTLIYFFAVFELDDDFDEESAVHEVVYNMLERDVVDLNSVNDELMFKAKTKKFKDPTPKMKLRHEQVNLYEVLMPIYTI